MNSVQLPPQLDIRHAAELKALLCAAAELEQPVVLDASGVERIDTAGAQLLAAAMQQRLATTRPNEVVRAALTTLGLDSLLAPDAR